MTALELNAQIWRSIAEIADDESLMKQLAKYLKKLAAKKEKDETLVSKEEFMASLDRGEEEYRQGCALHRRIKRTSQDRSGTSRTVEGYARRPMESRDYKEAPYGLSYL